MTWFADLSPCTYFREPAEMKLTAVGWLSEENEFTIGPVEPSVIQHLQWLLKAPFSPWMYLGYHLCELCSAARSTSRSERLRRGRFPEWRSDLPTTILRYKCEGTRNLLVPGEHEIYACPELILHYIGAHGYSPPEEFCDAVLRCPNTHSDDYFDRLVEVGGEAWPRFIHKARVRELEILESLHRERYE